MSAISELTYAWFDGGSRDSGNLAASGWIIRERGVITRACGILQVGKCTNNLAEIRGLANVMETLLAIERRNAHISGDSNLVIQWIEGKATIEKNSPNGQEIMLEFERIKQMETKFDSLQFQHIPREINFEADGMCNVVMDDRKNYTGDRGLDVLTAQMVKTKKWIATRSHIIKKVCQCPFEDCAKVFDGNDLHAYPKHLHEAHPGRQTIDFLELPSSRKPGVNESAHAIHCPRCFLITLNLNGHKGCTSTADKRALESERAKERMVDLVKRLGLKEEMLRDPNIGGHLDRIPMPALFGVGRAKSSSIYKFCPQGGLLRESLALCWMLIVDLLKAIPRDDPQMEVLRIRGWKMLFLLHSTAFAKYIGKGKKKDQIRERLNWVTQGQWLKLVNVFLSSSETVQPPGRLHVAGRISKEQQQRVMQLTAEGHVSKAWDTLKSSVLPKQETTVDDWRKQAWKHFVNPYSTRWEWNPQDEEVISFNNEATQKLKERLHKLPWRKVTSSVSIVSATDGSGIAADHMRAVFEHQPNAIITVLKWIAIGDVPGEVAEWLYGAKLLFIPKPIESTLEDEERKFRPISIGSVLVRVVSKVLAEDHRDEAAKFLAPLGQCAVGVKSGGDHFIHAIRLRMEHLRQNGCSPSTLKFDVVKGFTRISRRRIFEVLAGTDGKGPLSSLIPIFMALYGRASKQYSTEHGRYVELQEGVTQGDPLSMLFFCIATAPAIDKLLSEVEVPVEVKEKGEEFITSSKPRTVMYADDGGSTVGHIAWIRSLIEAMEDPSYRAQNPDITFAVSKYGVLTSEFTFREHTITHDVRAYLLRLENERKVEDEVCDDVLQRRPCLPGLEEDMQFWNNGLLRVACATEVQDQYEKVIAEGMQLLGVPMGTREWEQHVLLKIIAGAIVDMQLLLKVPSAQSAMVILRFCVVSKMSYMMRTGRHEVLMQIAHVWDEAVLSMAKKILRMSVNEVDVAGNCIGARMQWPTKFGGLGLTPISMVNAHARLSAICDVSRKGVTVIGKLPMYGAGDTMMKWLRGELNAHNNLLLDDFKVIWDDTRDACYRVIGDDVNTEATQVKAPVTVMDILKTRPKLQERLVTEIFRTLFDDACLPATSDDLAVTRAVLISASQFGGPQLYQVVPTDKSLYLSNAEYCLAVRQRFAVSPARTGLGTCRCGKPKCYYEAVDEEDLMRHIELCSAGMETMMRHDVLVKEFYNLLKRLGIIARYEPRGMLPTAGKGGPDLLAMGYPSYYISMLGDVSVANVKSSKKALEWNSTALAAANARDQDKIKKWDPQCKAVGMRFESLSFEAQGAFGSGVRRMLKYAENAGVCERGGNAQRHGIEHNG